jgi:hypothetical protein
VKKLSILHIILMVLVVAVAAVSVFFMSSYQKAEAKQPDMMNEINLALMRLEVAKEENDPEPFKQQFDELQAKIKTLIPDEPLFPEEPASVEIEDLIIDSVHKLLPAPYGLLKLLPNPEAGTVIIKSSEDSEGTKYSKAEYEVRVKGDLPRINSLIGEIEVADFVTLTIEDMQISYEMEKDTDTGIITSWWEAEFTVVTLYQYEK